MVSMDGASKNAFKCHCYDGMERAVRGSIAHIVDYHVSLTETGSQWVNH